MSMFASILKHMRNFNEVHFEGHEIVEVQRTKYGNTFVQTNLEIKVRPIKRMQRKCPHCLKEGINKQYPGYDYKRAEPSKWRTLDCFGVPTYLVYRPERISCPVHGIVTEYIPWADGTSRFTSEFTDTVTFMTCRASMSFISEWFDISWETAAQCVNRTLARMEPDRRVRLEGLTIFCVDETSYKRGYKYITVVFDMERCRVVWIHVGNGLEVYQDFVLNYLTEEQRSNIQLVAGDGARWIDDCMNYFPNAKRVVDPFHVVSWVQDALDAVRKIVSDKAQHDLRVYQEQCVKAAKEAREAELRIMLEIEHTQAELARLPHRGRDGKRKKELKAYLAELLTQKAAMETPASENDQTASEPVPVLTEEERAKLQREYDSMPRKGKKSARKKELERLLGITSKSTASKKHAAAGSDLTPEQEAEIAQLKEKVAAIKGARFALYHNPENRTDNQTDKLKWIEASCPELYKAYRLKEQIRTAIHMADPDLAGKTIEVWIEDAKSSGLEPMVKLAEKIHRHTDDILDSIRFKANSSRSESCNTTIKALIAMGRGFKNIDNLIGLIYFRCSELDVPLFNRPFKSSEYKAEQRERARFNRHAREAKKKQEKLNPDVPA